MYRAIHLLYFIGFLVSAAYSQSLTLATEHIVGIGIIIVIIVILLALVLIVLVVLCMVEYRKRMMLNITQQQKKM